MMKQDAKIYIAGHRGLVGSALRRRLQAESYSNLITRTHAELDLTDQRAVEEFFDHERPEYVFLAAARVGGILANATYPAEFIRDNLAIQTNVIHAAWKYGVKRLLFLGSSCIYPRDCPQPIKEEYLLTGPLEPTNRPYAVAKIAGIEMCWAYNRQYGTRFLAVMPTNLFGPGDNYGLEKSHVIPAMIRKFHLAQLAAEKNWPAIEEDERRHGPIPPEIRHQLHDTCFHGREPVVILWGTGTPRREFLYSDDMADACVFLMNLPDEEFDSFLGHPSPLGRGAGGEGLSPLLLGEGLGVRATSPLSLGERPGVRANHPPLINIGTGEDITIRELAELIAEVVGYTGRIEFDTTKPDGTPRKVLDTWRLRGLGWTPQCSLTTALLHVYRSEFDCLYCLKNVLHE
jgi:GDP-L-fucose synthase